MFTSTSKTRYSQVTKMWQSHMHFVYLFITSEIFTNLSILRTSTAAPSQMVTLVRMALLFQVTTVKAICTECGTKSCTHNTITSQDLWIKVHGMLSSPKFKVWWLTVLKQYQTQKFIKIWMLRVGHKTATTLRSRDTTESKSTWSFLKAISTKTS